MGYNISYTPFSDKVEFITIHEGLNQKEINEIVRFGVFDRIQCTKLPTQKTLELLNEKYYSRFPKTGFRLFGSYSEPRDLSPLKEMNNLEDLSIDCMQMVENTVALSSLQRLKKINIEVEKLTNMEFINTLPKTLNQLELHTNSKAFDISILTRFEDLKVLFLGGYKKNIESLSALRHLENLTLSGVTLNDVSFLNNILALKCLRILRGNTLDFSGLYGNKTIKAMELFRINNFTDIDLLRNLPNLEAVELCQLRHITQFPILSEHTSLKHIYMEDMKSLVNLSSLEFINQLESFSASCCPSTFEIDCIMPVLKNPSVKQCSFHTGSEKKNEEINQCIEQYKKQNANNGMILSNMLFAK